MRAFTQFVLPLIIIALVVGGVQFARHYTSGKRPTRAVTTADPAASPGQTPMVEAITFAERVRQADPEDPSYAGEYEHRDNGFALFLFANATQAPVNVGVARKSCTCTDIQIGTSTPAEGADWLCLAGGDSARALVAPLGLDVLGPAALARLATRFQMTKIDPNDVAMPVKVPAPAGGPVFGAVRFGFNARDAGAKRLSSIITSHAEGAVGRSETPLEMPVNVVPALRTPLQVHQLGDIVPGSTLKRTFLLWSSTRPTLDLKIFPVQTVEGCVEFGPPRPLSELERKALQHELNTGPNGEKKPETTRVRSAVEIPLTVHERKGDQSLDLGPLTVRYKVELPDKSQDHVVLAAQGVVRGEVRVVEAGDRDQIDLKGFSARLGARTAVTLQGTRPDVKLAFEGVQPDSSARYVTAKLEEQSPANGRPRWKLTVEVPPNAAAGPLPAQTAVSLKIGDGPRRVRIPVLGTAEGR
jgi:hypothetical protein